MKERYSFSQTNCQGVITFETPYKRSFQFYILKAAYYSGNTIINPPSCAVHKCTYFRMFTCIKDKVITCDCEKNQGTTKEKRSISELRFSNL
jgi:hypothetical protein